MMKFRLEAEGVRYELAESDLRAGYVHAYKLDEAGNPTGELLELVSPAQFRSIVNNYVDGMTKKGVRRFIYAFEERGEVHFYALLPSQVKSLATQLYSLNTAGRNALLSVSFRATRIEKSTLKEHGKEVDAVEAEAFHAICENNNGYKGEIALYGRAQHRATSSDGKVTLPSGKKAASQLKTCSRNSSKSLSKSHDIWTAANGIPEA